MVQMTVAEIQDFFATPRFAVFGTTSSAGSPQLSTVWFTYEGTVLYFGIERRSQKYRNMMRDPRVSVCIDGEHPDGRTVVVHGTAEVLEDGNPERIVWQMIRRYHDTEEQAREYQAEIAGLDIVVVKLAPERTVATNYSE